MASFETAIPFILANEGGFQANPADSGNYDADGNLIGTNYGISGQVARIYGYDGPMEQLPLETAKAIYYDLYWTGLDEIQSDAIATKILDYFVNFGRGGGTKIVQRAANEFEGINLAVDGGFGPATIGAVNSIDPIVLMDSLIAQATEQYKAIAASDPEKAGFLPGWMARVIRIPAENPGASASVLLLLAGGAYLFLKAR